MEATRASIFSCIRDKFSKLTNDLADCNKSKEEIEASLNLKIRELEAELSALKLSTNQEITKLQAEKVQLEKDLLEAREAYKTLADLNGEKAQQLISILSETKIAYQSLVAKRTDFLENLDNFKDRMKAFTHKHKVDSQEIANEICGSDAPNLNSNS